MVEVYNQNNPKQEGYSTPNFKNTGVGDLHLFKNGKEITIFNVIIARNQSFSSERLNTTTKGLKINLNINYQNAVIFTKKGDLFIGGLHQSDAKFFIDYVKQNKKNLLQKIA